MTPLEAAHEYARKGWPVVPLHGITDEGICRCRDGSHCNPKSWGKHPSLGRRWHELALVGGANVHAWYEDHPHDNVGILTGPESGVFVFDVDGAKGVASVVALTVEHGALPSTRMVRTGSGGLHYFFRHPGHFLVHNSASYLAPGIDIRGVNGQVVAPPSRSGKGLYEVIADTDVAEAPAWLLERLREHSEHVEHGRKAEVVGAAAVDTDTLPERVAHLARQTAGQMDRSSHFYGLVGACYENGYTQGQTVTIVAPWCAAVGKYVGKVEQEVARSWAKFEAESARANEWVAGLGDVPTKTQEEAWNERSTSTLSSTTTAPAASTMTGGPSAPGTPSLASLAAPAGSSVTSPSGSTPPDDPPDLPASWAPVDPRPYLDGTYEAPQAQLFPRSDGRCLLYRGLVHSFHGESESGKSLIAQGEVARVLRDGGTAAYIDFESDGGSVYGRLVDMGAPRAALEQRFSYRRPDTDPFAVPSEREAYADLLARALDLVIIDGVTDALSVFGAASNDMDDVTHVLRRFPRKVAQRTGAAVVMIDHVTKDADSRGRHAVGSQAKLNGLDGAAYVIEIAEVLGQGLRGVVTMRVGKDRPGGVRPHAGEWRKTDRTQLAARVVIDSTGSGTTVTVEAPESTAGAVLDDGRELRPGWLTLTMERVSDTLADAGSSLSKNKIETRTKGNVSAVRKALKALIDEGFVAVVQGTRGDEFVPTRRYLQAEDELSEEYLGWAGKGTGLATSSNLVPTSSPAERTNLVPDPPPLRGGDEVRGRGLGATSSFSLDEVRDEVETSIRDVSCKGCFAPTPENVANLFEGRCSKCARAAGLA